MTDPLRDLFASALDLMNGAFAPAGDAAAAKLEFFHQFRKLWDRGIPVGLGLGHILLKDDGECLIVDRIAERGTEGARLAVIAIGPDAESCHRRLGPSRAGRRFAIVLDGKPGTFPEDVTVLTPGR